MFRSINSQWESTIMLRGSNYYCAAATFSQIAFVNSEHFALPPKSPVKYLASLIVAKHAFSITSACLFKPIYRNIITADRRRAVGLALS